MFLLSWPGGDWQATLKIFAALIIIYLAAIWLALVYWTYRDIRQRSRDPVMQTVAVLLVLLFFFPGHWIYLVVRPRYTLTELYERSLEEEALLQELEDQKACPNCRRRVREEFLICPSCRAQLKEPCRSCARPLSYAWIACPYCGLEKPGREGAGARPVRPGVRRPTRQQAPAPGSRPAPQHAMGTVQQAATQPPGPPPRSELADETAARSTRPPSRDPFAPRPAVQSAPVTAEEPPVIGE